MEHLKLKLTLLEESILVPNTGRFTNNSSSATYNIIAITIIIAMLTFLTWLVVRNIRRNKGSKLVSIVVLFVLFGAIGILIGNSSAINDYAPIQVTEELVIGGEVTDAAFFSGKANVKMLEATSYGYELYALADSPKFTPETEGNKTVIKAISEPGALATNTYGFTFETNAKAEDAVWYPLSEVASMIDSYSIATAADKTTGIYFGVLVDETAEPDTYTLDIDFYATKKAASIGALTYMQDFKTLSDTDKALVLSSMTLNTQYTLLDSRDDKEYYIAKLADGNVWMTQNLDHDIVTTENFYTPDNTDIPANWTASAETYTDSSWDSSNTTPESYNPGEKCWNESIRSDTGGTISNSTISCDETDANKHYALGNYYNWTAAVAINDSSSYTTSYDVDQSICPAGWRLPTNTGDESFQSLVDTLDLNLNNIQDEPVYFTFGSVWTGSIYRMGNRGYYWSSVANNTGSSMGFIFIHAIPPNGYDTFNPHQNPTRSTGLSVRCLLR